MEITGEDQTKREATSERLAALSEKMKKRKLDQLAKRQISSTERMTLNLQEHQVQSR